MNVYGRAFVASGVLVLGLISGAQEKLEHSREQTKFSAEAEAVNHPVAIPDDVLSLLEHDDMVKETLKDPDPAVQTVQSSWFSASQVHLAGPGEEALVILAEGQLRGANVIMFWVFRKTAQGYELVLRAPAARIHAGRPHPSTRRDAPARPSLSCCRC